MSGDKNKFSNLRKQKGKVTFGDNASGNIIGKGTVNIGKDKAKNVLLVENMKPILFVVRQTCDQGNICIFYSQKCEIRRKNSGKLVGVASRTPENVYILNTRQSEKCHMNLVNESWLWNRRLGHINFDNIMKVRNIGVVRNLPKIIKPSNPICRHCQLGKHTRVRLKKKHFLSLSFPIHGTFPNNIS